MHSPRKGKYSSVSGSSAKKYKNLLLRKKLHSEAGWCIENNSNNPRLMRRKTVHPQVSSAKQRLPVKSIISKSTFKTNLHLVPSRSLPLVTKSTNCSDKDYITKYSLRKCSVTLVDCSNSMLLKQSTSTGNRSSTKVALVSSQQLKNISVEIPIPGWKENSNPMECTLTDANQDEKEIESEKLPITSSNFENDSSSDCSSDSFIGFDTFQGFEPFYGFDSSHDASDRSTVSLDSLDGLMCLSPTPPSHSQSELNDEQNQHLAAACSNEHLDAPNSPELETTPFSSLNDTNLSMLENGESNFSTRALNRKDMTTTSSHCNNDECSDQEMNEIPPAPVEKLYARVLTDKNKKFSYLVKESLLQIELNSKNKGELSSNDDIQSDLSQLRGQVTRSSNKPLSEADIDEMVDDCTKKFSFADLADEKVKTVHIKGKKRFCCQHCDETFPRLLDMFKHRVIHFDVFPYQCPLCDQKYKISSELHAHLVSHCSPGDFTCSLCDTFFQEKAHLDSHMLLHSPSKSFKCLFCPKVFTTKSQLNKHKSNHKKEQGYRCEVCDTTYKSKYYRTMHMRIHTKERPLKCDECDATFLLLFPLKLHKLGHHRGIKPYVCPECFSEFAYPNGIRGHLLRFHPEKSFS